MIALVFALTSPVADAASVDEVLTEIGQIAPLRSMRKARQAPAIPEQAYRNAAEGKPSSGVHFVDGVAAGKGWGVAIFDQPVESVWMAVNSDESFADRLPLSTSTIIEGDLHRDGRILFQYMPLPIVKDRWWIVDVRQNSELYQASNGKLWELAWTDATDEARLAGRNEADVASGGIPVAWTHGSWLMVELDDGRTLVEYFAWSDPGGLIPAGPASRFARSAILKTFKEVEAMAREYGAAQPGGYVKPDQTPL